MATDMGMINDFIQKEEEVKEQVFSGTKHHCIFEITHPNKSSSRTSEKTRKGLI